MLVGDPVGGCLDASRPEEAHRPAAAPPTPAVRIARLAGHRRFRLQCAGLVSLALIGLLAFVLLPPRTVRIATDGDVATVRSWAASDRVVVEQAGIALAPGDWVEVLGDGTLAVRRATDVTLRVDGQTYGLRTQAETVETLLTEAEVPFGERDSVLRDGVFVAPAAPLAAPAPFVAARPLAGLSATPASEEPVTVEVRRAVPFTVIEDGQELQLRSSRETVETALRDVGVRLGPGDKVQPSLDAGLTAGMEVRVQHTVPVVVTLPDGKLVLYSLAATVGEALAEGGVALPARFRLEPPADTPLRSGLAVHVIGIAEGEELEQERIESETVYRPDSSLPYGERRVVEGRDGVRYREYHAVYENGDLISRELVAEWFDPEPADTIVYYSTAAAPPPPPPVSSPPPSSAPDGLNVASTLRVYATWYNAASSGRPPSDPYYGITATGVRVDRGIIAVDPSVIPLGTRLYIPGYGFGVAADTGGGIRGNMIDLGYPDGVVPDWTSRWVDIYILGP